jgi:CheY-like chemotaxis protein
MALAEIPQQSPLQRNLEHVLGASLRARDLVRQILAVSRLTPEQKKAPTDLSLVIKEALKLLRSTIPSSVELRQGIQPGVALADPTQIHQIVMNLCTNAVHAMNDKGILEVSLAQTELEKADIAALSIVDLRPGPHLRLAVADTGSGMDAETMERIFDPYFTTKHVGKGSGLGLAVVFGIVKRHEGAITVQSEPGKGSVFTVYLPRVDACGVSEISAAPLLSKGSERVLIVDDEQAVLQMGTEVLEHLGYNVVSECDCMKALDLFRSKPGDFDLVITDYTMPKLNGLDFAAEVRRTRPEIPVILCTGFSEKVTPDSLEGLEIEVLFKPYGMKQISEAVRKLLDRPKPTVRNGTG